ncbi:MAG: A/G-specific adenine glycosylase [Candidatus Niyogibacteria bacterium]|nr:A/G-specific adenine glycosylase [Candidatus Niyogibacteria bacterium]
MDPKQFQKIIRKHYRKNKKKNNFPWRRTKNPYHILVSEIMLQQTQIPRVIPKYNEWIKTFPTIQALAKAPFSKVMSIWHGLGYNRRARYLKDAAEKIIKLHKNKIPRDPNMLETLPGIGRYTARAVSCFAYGICEPFLDTNIRRVYIHFFGGKKEKITDETLLMFIQKTAPIRNKDKWYGALMDYGRDIVGDKKDNPNRKSKTYSKQSPFLGSRRYIRAKIITYLLNHKTGTTTQIKHALKKDIHAQHYLADRKFLSLISSLQHEGMLSQSSKRLSIRR